MILGVGSGDYSGDTFKILFSKIIWPEKLKRGWKHCHTVYRFKFVKIMITEVWLGKNWGGVGLEVSHRMI